MRILPFLLLVLWVSPATAGAPITSFEPDTTTKHAPRDTVDRPVWVGLHAAPFAGGSLVPGHPDAWDTRGTPWVGLSAAWPAKSPHESWLMLGYEHWSFARKSPVPLPALVVDLLTVRTGVDGLICRDCYVSGAIGAGGGTGYGQASFGTSHQNVVPVELLGHAVMYVHDRDSRIGLGVSFGETWLVSRGDVGDPFVHWEVELRLDRAVGGSGRRSPTP